MTSATRTEGVGVGADMEGGGMGKEEEMGGMGKSGMAEWWGQVEKWRWGKGKDDIEGEMVEQRGRGSRKWYQLISQRLSLQHTPEGLHPFPIRSGHMKTAVSAPAVENESPREHLRSLGSHLRRSHGYTHTPTPKSQERVTDSHKQTHGIRSPYRYVHRTECVDTQDTHIPRHTHAHTNT